jgi:cob(I)alamin adenosyltransferase
VEKEKVTMKIYTKTGDKGETGTFEGRISKADKTASALGSIDELSCWVGVGRDLCEIQNSKVKGQNFDLKLKSIQTNLMIIGSIIAGSKKYKFLGNETRKLERLIDKLDRNLPKLHNFVYPKGFIHVARAVARRVEREVVGLQLTNTSQKNILKYLNRLSDGLFVIARYANHYSGLEEEVWA